MVAPALPTDQAKLDRARSLCSDQCWTIRLQVRRLRTTEPEDDKFVFRFWADLQFLVVALRRLRRAASIAKFNPVVASAIADFDRALPGLSHMRNVAEHVDEYAVDSPRRGNKQIFRQSLQVGFWGDPVYKWLGYELNVDEAVAAADALFIAVRTASELP